MTRSTKRSLPTSLPVCVNKAFFLILEVQRVNKHENLLLKGTGCDSPFHHLGQHFTSTCLHAVNERGSPLHTYARYAGALDVEFLHILVMLQLTLSIF